MHNDNHADATLSDFFQEFIRKHAVVGTGGGEVELDITPEECEMLGRSFVQILSQWIGGVKVVTLIKFLTKGVISAGDGEVNVAISAEECEELGRDFIQIMVGWAAGVTVSRQKRMGAGMAIDSTKVPPHLKVVNMDEHRGDQG